MMFDFSRTIRDWNGQVVGYECVDCGDVVHALWGGKCRKCQIAERRHIETLEAMKVLATEKQSSEAKE